MAATFLIGTPTAEDFVENTDVIGKGLDKNETGVDNQKLIKINETIRNHHVEYIGYELNI